MTTEYQQVHNHVESRVGWGHGTQEFFFFFLQLEALRLFLRPFVAPNNSKICCLTRGLYSATDHGCHGHSGSASEIQVVRAQLWSYYEHLMAISLFQLAPVCFSDK